MHTATSDARLAAARMLMVGFPGAEVTPALGRLLEAGVSGCIFFRRNAPEPSRVAGLAAAIKGRAGRALLLSIDQEGGRVARLGAPFAAIPSMREIGATGDATLARDAGWVIGREMRAAGFDVVLAPVMDVDTNPANPVIADRSFGRDADLVSRMGVAFIEGLQSTTVAGCAKHFPGHGDTSQDSHHDLPRLAHDLERLERVELPPFRAAVEAGVASVMSAHVIFSPLDARYPATMSHVALGAILRDRFGFGGVIISDDVEMKALADHYALEEQLLRGVEAGIDLFLVCHTEEVQFRAIDVLAAAIGRGTISAHRVAHAITRIDNLTSRHFRDVPPEPLEVVQSARAHRAAAARLATVPTTAGRDPTSFK